MKKSEELCNALGIKPRFKVVVEGMKRPHSNWTMTGETFATEEEAQDYINRIVTPYKTAYPVEFKVDLKNAENFLTLLELGTKGCTLWWKVNARAMLDGSGLPSNQDEFIEKLLRYVPDDQETQKLAQKAKWNY